MSADRAVSDESWAHVPTGLGLAAALDRVQPAALPDERLLELLAAQARQLAYQQAEIWTAMAEIATRDPMPHAAVRWNPEQVFESAVDEIRAELRLTRRAARRELERAQAVVALPRVIAALAAGELDRGRAIVLGEGCADLTPEQAETLLDELLVTAGTVTATGLAERVRRVAIALDPAWAERRYREAVRDRRVIGYLNEDGSATVSGQYLPAEQAAAACARVDALADAAKRAGADAPIDHLRAELFLGLLDGRFHGVTESAIVTELLRRFPSRDARDAGRDDSGANGLHLTVGLATLLGLDDAPGEIAGWGPVTAAVARQVAGRQHRAEWRFAIVDEHGQLLGDGVTRRRPTQRATANDARGGIVELHVSAALLADRALAASHPAWAGVLADLTAQHTRRQPIVQDPSARFAGRPLRRRVQLMFQRCTFPGCRRPATDCDLDHRREHAQGGRTEADNLGPACRHDHGNKTTGGWRLVSTGPRSFTWISPLGRRHTVDVPPVANPLPKPLPRRPGPSHGVADLARCDQPGPTDAVADLARCDQPGPTLRWVSRRGRRVYREPSAGAPPGVTVGSGPDPPPY